jgi:hypothetical protein
MKVNYKKNQRRANPGIKQQNVEPIVYEKKSLVPKENSIEHIMLGSVRANVSYMKYLHSDIEPAIIYENGDWTWYKHGIVHRDGGPAVRQSGNEIWYQNALPHREDGPAIIRSDGTTEFWVRGVKVDNLDLIDKKN